MCSSALHLGSICRRLFNPCLRICTQWCGERLPSACSSQQLLGILHESVGCLNNQVPAHRIIIGGFAQVQAETLVCLCLLRLGCSQGAGCAVRAALSFPDAPLGGAIALSGFFGAPEVARQNFALCVTDAAAESLQNPSWTY